MTFRRFRDHQESDADLDDLLNASRWAKQLTAKELNQIRRDSVVRTIPAGGYLCMKGEAVEYWTGIIDGLAKMTSHWPNRQGHQFRRPVERLLVR